MLLFKITQKNNLAPDTWHGAIVAAESPDVARQIHPGTQPGNSSSMVWSPERNGWLYADEVNDADAYCVDDWAPPHLVAVTLIGVAVGDTLPGVILSSYRSD